MYLKENLNALVWRNHLIEMQAEGGGEMYIFVLQLLFFLVSSI